MSASPFDVVAQSLQQVEQTLRPWLQRPHRWPLKPDHRASLERHAEDLTRQARELIAERPSLVVILMGGTGVGKSTLLNALAQGSIADAAFTRPTTREPIVYLHEKFDSSRLDESLQKCRLIRHHQPGFEYKILVDTPDLDSNESIHRERLEAVLPAADIILYVGSQEKYHDIAGWELFLKQKERRAFAFVLNKWDRCVVQHATGVRPDDDLLRDLKAEGFIDPLLFRICAHAWLTNPPKGPLPEGEQFLALRTWLEQGLTKREMEAIRTQGVGQLLQQLQTLLKIVQPPDVKEAARKTDVLWKNTISSELITQKDVILANIAPHQKTLERRFANHLSHPFKGYMGMYASLLDFGRQGMWTSKLPQVKTAGEPVVSDLTGFARSCAQECYRQSLTARNAALVDRLVAHADDAGLPTHRLESDLQAQLSSITEATYADALSKALSSAEHSLAGPQSWRQRMASVWTWLGYLLPATVFLIVLIWQLYAKFAGTSFVSITDLVLLPPLSALLVMTVLYILYRSMVPVTWNKLSSLCRDKLGDELAQRFSLATQALPQQQATILEDERAQVTGMLAKVEQAKGLIAEQEKTSHVAILYAR